MNKPSNNVKTVKSKKLSRRRFIGGAAGSAAALVAAGGPAATILSGQVPAAGTAARPDLTLVNGRIHTMDGRNTIANAVAIRNGRFVSVGQAPPPAPGVRVIDLKGLTVV